MLSALCRRPGRWILIVEDNLRRHLFWQALAFEDGSLCTEVVSNTYLDGDDAWTPEQETRLLALGWDPPNPPKRPNWIHVEATTAPDTETEARRAIATFRAPFGLGDDEVFVKMFSSALRGDTPASPLYEAITNEGERDDAAAGAPRRHYFRPNVDQYDEEFEADIEAWLNVMFCPVAESDNHPRFLLIEGQRRDPLRLRAAFNKPIGSIPRLSPKSIKLLVLATGDAQSTTSGLAA